MTSSFVLLQVLPSLGQGGVEHATFDMAEALCEVFPDCPTYVGSSGGDLLGKPHGFIHLTLPLHSKNPFRILLNAYRLRMFIQQYSITLVHGRSRSPSWSAWLACRLTGVPFITTYHGAYKAKSSLKKLYNSVMARGEKVIAISNYMKKHIEKHYPFAKTELVYEGINTDFYQSTTKASGKTIFLPCRLSPIKGVHIAIGAFQKVVEKHTDARLMLIRIGKKNYIEEIDKLIERLNLKAHVEFIEPTSDLRPYYERSAIILVASVVPEALGRVSLEALAMERLLIATDLGANPEICIEGMTGFLVSPANVGQLASALVHCLTLDDEMKNRIARNGRAHVEERFSSKSMFEKMIDLYKSL